MKENLLVFVDFILLAGQFSLHFRLSLSVQLLLNSKESVVQGKTLIKNLTTSSFYYRKGPC
jgi:hypothetical protein